MDAIKKGKQSFSARYSIKNENVSVNKQNLRVNRTAMANYPTANSEMYTTSEFKFYC